MSFSGHDFHMKSTPLRTYQQCYKCGKERTGWTIDEQRKTRLQKSKRTAEQDKKISDIKNRRRA
jgi:hypothetical protein